MTEYISILLTTILGLIALFLNSEKDKKKQPLWKKLTIIGWVVGLLIIFSTINSFYEIKQKNEQSRNDSIINKLEYEMQMSTMRSVIDNQKLQLVEQKLAFQEQKFDDSTQSILIHAESKLLDEKLNTSEVKIKNLERRLYPIEDLSFFIEIRFKLPTYNFNYIYKKVQNFEIELVPSRTDGFYGVVIDWQDTVRSKIVTDLLLPNDLFFKLRAYEKQNANDNEWLFYNDEKIEARKFIVWIDLEREEFVLKLYRILPNNTLLSPQLVGLNDLIDKYFKIELFAYKSIGDLSIKSFNLSSRSGFSFKSTEFAILKFYSNDMKTFGSKLVKRIDNIKY